MSIFRKLKNLSLGARGENASIIYLKNKGYKILARNLFNPSGRRLGEIDIIAKDGEQIVFVEVKTRMLSNFKQPPPEESITPTKLQKLNKIASFYLAKNRLLGTSYRFDAITLIANPENSQAKIRHLKNIFI